MQVWITVPVCRKTSGIAVDGEMWPPTPILATSISNSVFYFITLLYMEFIIYFIVYVNIYLIYF